MTKVSSGAQQKLASCTVCHLAIDMRDTSTAHARCPRCHARVSIRKPHSLGKCWAFLIAALLASCNSNSYNSKKEIDTDLATIGLLMYDGVLTTEVTATADVFSKASEDDEQFFNVITIAQTKNPITTEEGLTIIPDFSFDDCPDLDVLFVPSAYDMASIVKDDAIIQFIRDKNELTTYTVSHCDGAQLIGASGIANGFQIITCIGGGEQLKKDYPELIVQDDATVTHVEDGKFSSSNGNLASYITALNLLEKMTSPQHRKYVESYIYLERLQNWNY